jgi:hypothetical protein
MPALRPHQSADLHIVGRPFFGVFIRRADSGYIHFAGWHDHPKFYIWVHSLSARHVSNRLGNFRLIRHQFALGKYLLGFINLMPVNPLDGGNVTRYILVQTDPWNGVRTSLWISVIAGAAVAIAGLVFLRSTYMAILFGLLAFQSYQALQGGIGRGY